MIGTTAPDRASSMTMMLVVRLLVVVLSMAGCALVPAPDGGGPLVTIESHGGLCPDGECRSVVAIERDGRVHRTKPDVADMTTVSSDVIAGIDGAILATDFAALRSRPFTGECPTAFDGQELIYTFATPSGQQRIATCEVEIDPEHPLFVAVQAALGAMPP